MRPRHPLLLILAVLVAGASYFLLHAYAPKPPSLYPEFDAVPSADLERARRALPKRGGGFGGEYRKLDDREAAALDACSPRAVVAALHEGAGEATGAMSYGPCFDDISRRPVGVWLADRTDASLTAVLLRLASDEDLEFNLRDTAVVALCWEGNEGALPGLVRLAMDKEANDTVRTRVFSRLVRIGIPPGGGFEALLHLPFRDHDQYAAAVLALTGRPMAPSLVVEALGGYVWRTNDREHLLVRAAAAIAADDREIAAQARIARQAVEASWGVGPSPGVPEKAAVANLAPLLSRWLDEHPEARTSRFERERRAFRVGARYAREQRVLLADDPAAIPEEEFDFGASALRITYEKSPGRTTATALDRDLGALSRLAALFRRELEGVTDPEEKLRVLHRRLLVRHVRFSFNFERGPSSFLGSVLSQRAGNCVGLTSLYVALGERLDLPLVAVSLPRHVFLRWDDGETVIDVELTDQGRIRTAEYLEGAMPRVLTKKGFASVVLSNRGGTWLESPVLKEENRVEDALRFADEAIAYDPENDAAHLVRARCLARLGDEEGALAAARRALDLAPLDVSSPLVAAECLLLAGRPGEALAWFDRARGIDPDDGDVLQGRLNCLSRLGRHEEVIDQADAFLGKRDHRGVRIARFGAMVRLDRDGWRAEMARLAPEPPGSWTLRISVAEALLDRSATKDALAMLDSLHDLEREAGKLREAVSDTSSVIERPDGVKILVRNAELSRLGRRAQTLRAEAYDQTGRAREAADIRRELRD